MLGNKMSRQFWGNGFMWFILGGAFFYIFSLFVGVPLINLSESDVPVVPIDNLYEGCAMERSAEKRAGEKGGTKYRTMKIDDLPPEMKEGWDPNAPEEPVSRLPQALILGFAKCGTGALVAFLPLHPDIVTVDWEVNYFCDQHYFQYPLKWYRQMMPPSYSHQVTIEKSPCYIMDRIHFERMKAYNSSLKVIITVRDPLDLLMSKYGQMMAGASVFGGKIKTVEEVLTKDGELDTHFVEKFAAFSNYVKEVYDVFPSKQIHIVDGDELIKNPLSELRKLETFLDIQHYFSEEDVYFDDNKGFYCYRYRETGVSECLGSAKGRKHETLSPELNATIRKHLKPFNEEFFRLVGKRYPWH